MLGGGIPEKNIIAVLGGYGSGKTILGMQFINRGLEEDERGVFISFDEDEDKLIRIASNIGWDFGSAIKDRMLVLIRLDAADIGRSLTRAQSELPTLIETFDAKRIVIDPITLFEMHFRDDESRRREISKLCTIIQASGATTMLTSEISTDNPFASKYGEIEYIADGVIIFQHIRPAPLKRSILAVEIAKMRGVKHARDVKPYDITDKGIVVDFDADLF
ncbi:MAG: circadian clock protein KaiC [Candidatus Syntrophoarchaeum caldarius]|uniref:Circadian clock protein KaiC n=1 Tax=Candidatus Syntropharchaeum caldarium TaxID=1838285 RepID=A0A1F2P869_9EURY|nr:MAG: circadian clock protein KaiC [Candidatus Syntrophoarchaeum caldarius]